jgi:hypothetical protein
MALATLIDFELRSTHSHHLIFFANGFYAFTNAEAPVSDCFLLQEMQELCCGQPASKASKISRTGAHVQ